MDFLKVRANGPGEGLAIANVVCLANLTLFD
jgi:hypothetical protein